MINFIVSKCTDECTRDLHQARKGRSQTGLTLPITVAFEDAKPYEQKPLTKKMMGSRSRTGNHERYESPVPGLENFLRSYPLAEVK